MKNKQRQYIVSFDKYILISYIALSLAGLLIMLDISSVRNSMVYFYKQFGYFIISIVLVLFILYVFDLVKLKFLNVVMIAASVVLLIAVLVYGSSVKGATRSLPIGPFNFQPSFFARVALVFFFAMILSNRHEELSQVGFVGFLKQFPILYVTAGILFILIFIEKHLSTLIISGSTLFGMLFLAGIKKRVLIIALVIGILAGILIIHKGDDYRAQRMEIYKHYCLLFKHHDTNNAPENDYQVRESVIALTSGRLLGTGTDRGRAKHYYLPEARTDYVFTIIGEEFGFLGAMLIFGLHCFLFFRVMKISVAEDDLYLKFLAAGLGMNIFINALVNVGVSMSILPSTGNTLPFISYSGTAFIIDSATIGVLLNISAKRKVV